ncbi:hypothetical protein H4F47_10375 [Pectobacterium brasiliense]|uniref:hypothetical protein n=1 Tax=Pectobacterium brasiliense TaxID=180957 RepID=UPI001969969B|nr:hypothetical protein [Pectobacterium brasiliense]MBN3043324.1 hypothetical protein [Pectobacterium brasiliense]
MSTEQIREEFEQWAELVGALPWGYLKKQRTPSGGYSVQVYVYMWEAWQASRSELLIELPSWDSFDTTQQIISEAAERVRAAGITVKEG